jgi:hypothetical protein
VNGDFFFGVTFHKGQKFLKNWPHIPCFFTKKFQIFKKTKVMHHSLPWIKAIGFKQIVTPFNAIS